MKKFDEKILKAKKKLEELEEARKKEERKLIQTFFGKIIKDKNLGEYLENKANDDKFKKYLLEKIENSILEYKETDDEGEIDGE